MEILDLSSDEVVRQVVEAITIGKVAVCPTDTVYGLIADATNQEAANRVFQIKGREEGKPLSVFVKDMEAARELGEISAQQEEYLLQIWPGKVTAVLKSKHKLSEVFEKDGKIGLRIPSHPLLLEILEKLGKPLTGTSANVSGQPSCLDSKEVIAQFKEREFQPDILIDAGKLPESNPSMVIDITKSPYRILRK